MMSAKNWDRRLRDEERKLSKLLDSICAKSDIKLDANGLPLLASSKQSSVTSKVTTFTQTEHQIHTSHILLPAEDEFDEALSTAIGSEYSQQRPNNNASFENVVFEQLRNDYEADLLAKDNQLQFAENRIQSLESALIETIKWRNSTCNHLSILLQTFNQTNHVQPSQKQSNKANIIFVSAQQQDKLVKLHHRMQELFEAKSMPAVPGHLQPFVFSDDEFQRPRVNIGKEQNQQQIDHFNTFHRDYDLVTPVAPLHSAAANNTTGGNYSSSTGTGTGTEDYNKLSVLAAQEEELCGLFFDLLTRIQVGSADYREMNNNNFNNYSSFSSTNNNNALTNKTAFNFNSLNVVNSSAEQLHSIGLRLFLTGLIALEVIDDVIDLRRAMEIFRQCTAGAVDQRLRYLDFIRAMDLLAALKFPALAAMATDIAKGRRNSQDFEEQRKSIIQQQRSSSLYNADTRSSVIMAFSESSAAAVNASTTSLFSIFPQAATAQSPKRASIQQAGARSAPRPPPPQRPPQAAVKQSHPVVIAKKREPLSSKALAAFAGGWTSKLQAFLQDFASLKRVISHCFLLTHPTLVSKLIILCGDIYFISSVVGNVCRSARSSRTMLSTKQKLRNYQTRTTSETSSNTSHDCDQCYWV